jgi:hypothetical protein
MKFRVELTAILVLNIFFLMAQPAAKKAGTKPLPGIAYVMLRDSTTSMDIVLMQGKGGSLSLEGKNVRFFNSFFEDAPATKSNVPLAGSIMWQINGREFISGNFYLGDSTGYVVFNKDGMEYVNLINGQGTSFFKAQLKK